ncbi:MAG: nitroreductase [Clostridiales bacterium]|nr:nitroreductase [Clostridiales bacterium]
MTIMEAVTTRRSIREYKEGEIPQADLLEILEAARLAPTWKNNQSFTYILVKDRTLMEQLGEITGYNPSRSAYEKASCYLVLCGDPTLSGKREGKEYYMVDAAIAMEQMMLAAHEKGYGMCWVGAFYENPVKKLLSVPEDIRVIALSPLGIPDEAPEARPRRNLNEVVYLDRYGSLL